MTSPASFDLSAIRLIVYDLDGTLLDAFEDIWRCMNRALAASGIPPLSLERVKAGVGDGAENLVRRCLGAEHAALVPEVLKSYLNFYANNPDSSVKLFPGVADALQKIRAMRLKQAILTNKPAEVTRQTCEALGLAGIVNGVWGAVDGGVLKPHPEALLQVVRHFNLTPGECLMVGDYRADFEVARAAGTRMAGVTWGLWTRQEIELQHPDLVLNEISELCTKLAAL